MRAVTLSNGKIWSKHFVSVFTDIYRVGEGGFWNFDETNICSISHNTLTLYTRIQCILRAVTLSDGEIWRKHFVSAFTDIYRVGEGGFWNFDETNICSISHHTLTLYTRIQCILRAVTLSDGEIWSKHFVSAFTDISRVCPVSFWNFD